MLLAKGTQLLIGDAGGSEVFSLVPAVTEFNPPPISWGTEDTTNHDSETPVTTLVSTLKTNGPVVMRIAPYDVSETNHALLRTLAQNGATRNFRLTYPGSSLGVYPFTAIVNNWQPITETGRIVAASVTLTPTGSVTDSAPTLASVVIADAFGGIYVTGDKLVLRATFDEIMKVTGTPRIAIVLASGTVYATYASGTLTNVLQFEKTFGGGDQADATEFSITSPIDLNGGTIKDMQVQASGSLAFTPPTTTAFTVNG